MINRQNIYKNFFANKGVEETITINDLREKEFGNEKLSENEAQALLNFDRFRLSELNKIKNENEFNARYCELQVMANLADYRTFLDKSFLLL